MYTLKHTPEENIKFLRFEYWQVVRPGGQVLGPRFRSQEEAQNIVDELNMCLEMLQEFQEREE